VKQRPVVAVITARLGDLERDVVVEADPSLDSAAIAAALGQALGAGSVTPALRAGERRVSGPFGSSALFDGDHVILESSESADPRDPSRRATVTEDVAVSLGSWTLVVVGGPELGRRVTLELGSCTVGRADTCTITLADAQVSREHVRLDVGPESVTVRDLGSRNGTVVDGERVDSPVRIDTSARVEVGHSSLVVARQPATPGQRAGNGGGCGQIGFNRPPRSVPRIDHRRHGLEPPHEEPEGRRLPLASAAVPVFAGLAAYLFTRNPLVLTMMIASPAMAFYTWWDDRRRGRGKLSKDLDRFEAEVNGLAVRVAAENQHERAQRVALDPDPEEVVARALTRSTGLWARRPNDPDFLSLRLGVAPQSAHLELEIDTRANEELAAMATAHLGPLRTIDALPVKVVLGPDVGSLGLVGDVGAIEGLVPWVIAQLACHHSPRDVSLVAMMPRAAVPALSWIKWLPHVRRDSRLPVVVCAADECSRLLESFAEVVEGRTELLRGHGQGPVLFDSIVAVLWEEMRLSADLVDRLLSRGPAVGVHVVWIGSRPESLPGGIQAIVEATSPATATLSVPSRHELVTAVELDRLDPASCDAVARALAPLRDVTAAEVSGGIPARVSLLEALATESIDAAAITQVWSASPPGLRAAVGADADGPVELDLVGDGPHGLIGGTTGAGKSEFLQSFVASLAARYPPELVSFLLIDYKGGAAFRDCTRLPHTVGSITSLDGALAQRALTSLRAERTRREKLLFDAGVSNLADYHRVAGSEVLPYLLVVVDEFAILKVEVPEFVDGLVDIAAVGRSLGMHLVLATQQPSGAVSEQIQNNCNYRVALRFSRDEDSQALLKSKQAARIPQEQKGRGFIKIGERAPRPFQAAYAGAVTTDTDELEVTAFDIGEGAVSLLPPDLRSGDTDLHRTIEACCDAFRLAGRPPLRRPWRDPLPPVVALGALVPANTGRPTLVPVGIADVPEEQDQRVELLDLELGGGAFVFGAGRSGKSSALRTIACAAASQWGPDDLAIYGLDFGSRGLAPLAELPQCGSVISGDDPARVQRLLTTLRRWIEQRRQLMSDLNAPSWSQARERDPERPPTVLVVLDEYLAFHAAWGQGLAEGVDELKLVVTSGPSVGIFFVVSAATSNGVPLGLLNALGTQIVLRMANPDEYQALRIPRHLAMVADPSPGGGFVREGVSVQLATVGATSDPIEEADAIASFAASHRAHWGERRAEPIRVLPSMVHRGELPAPSSTACGALGLDDDLQPAWVDLHDGNFIVVGPPSSGKTTALGALVASMARFDQHTRFLLVTARESDLSACRNWDAVAVGGAAAAALVAEVGLDPAELTVVVVDDTEYLSDPTLGSRLDVLVQQGRRRESNLRVLAAMDKLTARRSYSGWANTMCQDGFGLIFQPDRANDADFFGGATLPAFDQSLPTGRGCLTKRGRVRVVQVAA
jgi:S-DNA-T family DNA segregation ATPase FtsK/SpoIIIE